MYSKDLFVFKDSSSFRKNKHNYTIIYELIYESRTKPNSLVYRRKTNKTNKTIN